METLNVKALSQDLTTILTLTFKAHGVRGACLKEILELLAPEELAKWIKDSFLPSKARPSTSWDPRLSTGDSCPACGTTLRGAPGEKFSGCPNCLYSFVE